jgi:hypothetical protein
MKDLFASRLISGVTHGRKSNEPLFNQHGVLNASSKKDAIQQLASALAVLASKDDADDQTKQIQHEKSAKRKATLTAAWADNSGQQLAMLGGILAAQIEETTDRQGFCRQLLLPSELPMGDYPEVTVKFKYVTAYIMASASQVVPVEIRERRFLINEFDINARLLIDNREIARSRTDLLEEKYEEGLEAIMVQEDRYWKQLATRAAASRYNVQTSTTFTPQFFARMRDLIDREGLPVVTCIMASTLMQDIITSADFQNVFDPVTQREILETGEIGSLYNTKIYSDQVRQPEFRVMEDGEFFLVSAPINHGVIMTRPLQSTPTDHALLGEAKKGWFMNQQTSMCVVSNKSVVKGQRI